MKIQSYKENIEIQNLVIILVFEIILKNWAIQRSISFSESLGIFPISLIQCYNLHSSYRMHCIVCFIRVQAAQPEELRIYSTACCKFLFHLSYLIIKKINLTCACAFPLSAHLCKQRTAWQR